MIGGIDLGGTKIEARVFDANLDEVARHRIPTPTESYAEMLDGIAQQVAWLEAQGDISAIGLGSPGLINPRTGVMLTANLPATGQTLGEDISALTGQTIPVINDCRAFTLSEATMGIAAGFNNVVGLVIGTGVAGGHAVAGQLTPDLNGQLGEFGHLPLPADLVAKYNLPLIKCGCGLNACFETYLAGPGLIRLAKHMTGQDMTPQHIMTKTPDVRAAWLDLASSLASLITRTLDPEVIVLGGGLGMFAGLPNDLTHAMSRQMLANTDLPQIVQATHGDASGALGAAIHAQHALEASK